MLSATFHAPGNPDFRQYAPIAPSKKVTANTLDEISAAASAYIAQYDLGGGNWKTPTVTDETGKAIATISYNGKIWPVDA